MSARGQDTPGISAGATMRSGLTSAYAAIGSATSKPVRARATWERFIEAEVPWRFVGVLPARIYRTGTVAGPASLSAWRPAGSHRDRGHAPALAGIGIAIVTA